MKLQPQSGMDFFFNYNGMLIPIIWLKTSKTEIIYVLDGFMEQDYCLYKNAVYCSHF